ncbi:MAG TPA: 1-deoxy-D-xylulose-5-phosphate synthase [Firmicutes bacterium]|nr:1-deoxy-D-xylulose-5-phosphate synthase [Bacillota bacterium]
MARKRLLDSIDSPSDVKKLSADQLDRLCAEIREELIETISKNGGHLASNLGTVELTLALHRVFDSPQDKIVWDVGHQCYTHKLITGRRDSFHTIRKKDGLSGFPKPYESEHDAFVAGHSSTSVSVALGMAQAMRCQGDKHTAVAVIGDGSMTGGMVYEALNNAGRSMCNLVVVLNDNNMSISKNVGALSKYLTDLRTKPAYFRLKDFVERVLLKIPLVGKRLCETIWRSKRTLKYMLYKNTMFEDFGFVYLGPVDGHDIQKLTDVLERAKQMHCPVFVHVNTVKGKGYSYAEENPGAYHGVSQFDAKVGTTEDVEANFSSVFGRTLSKLADKNDRICAITAAMKYGTGLQYFSTHHKNRLYDVGIAEEHAVAFAAGLAKAGMIPVFAVYSTFLQRGYDQIVHDVALSGQKIILAVDRAGIVGDDGETHQGVFDVSFLSAVPGLTIYSPSNYAELRICLHEAVSNGNIHGCAVRYPRGKQHGEAGSITAVKGHLLCTTGDTLADILLVSYGRLIYECREAAQLLREKGIRVDFLKLVQIKPIENSVLDEMIAYRKIYFVEEGMQSGGIAEHILAGLEERGFTGKYHIRAIQDFVPHQSVTEALVSLGMDAQGLCAWIEETERFLS